MAVGAAFINDLGARILELLWIVLLFCIIAKVFMMFSGIRGGDGGGGGGGGRGPRGPRRPRDRDGPGGDGPDDDDEPEELADATAEGEIQDPSGNGLDNVTITGRRDHVRRNRLRPWRRVMRSRRIGTVHSGADGRYHVRDLREGALELTFTHPNYPPLTRVFTLTAGHNTLPDVRFSANPPPGRIEGSVSYYGGDDSRRVYLGNVRIEAFRRRDNNPLGNVTTNTADPEQFVKGGMCNLFDPDTGKFEIPDIPQGEEFYIVATDGWGAYRQVNSNSLSIRNDAFVVGSGQTLRMDIFMQPVVASGATNGEMKGVISSTSGGGIPIPSIPSIGGAYPPVVTNAQNIRVMVDGTNWSNPSDATGNYVLADVPVGVFLPILTRDVSTPPVYTSYQESHYVYLRRASGNADSERTFPISISPLAGRTGLIVGRCRRVNPDGSRSLIDATQPVYNRLQAEAQRTGDSKIVNVVNGVQNGIFSFANLTVGQAYNVNVKDTNQYFADSPVTGTVLAQNPPGPAIIVDILPDVPPSSGVQVDPSTGEVTITIT